jgi:hypothetical protein
MWGKQDDSDPIGVSACLITYFPVDKYEVRGYDINEQENTAGDLNQDPL